MPTHGVVVLIVPYAATINTTHRYTLDFVEASDDGLFEDDVYAARLDKEAAAVKVVMVVGTEQRQSDATNTTITPTAMAPGY